MRHRPSPLLVGLLAVLLLAVAAGVAWWLVPRGTTFARATQLAPADTQRISWVHWAEVRRMLEADVDADSSAEEVADFMDEAFGEDLATVSALPESTPVMHEEYPFSPVTVEWEMFAQGTEGAVEVLGMPEDQDYAALTDRLAELGYDPPGDDRESGGVWDGGDDLLPRIGPQLTPELQYVAVLADEGLVLTSDRADYLERAVDGVSGDADAVEGLDPVVEATGSPVVASVYSGEHTCAALAMSQADPTEQEQADALLARAGEVDPLTGFAISRQGPDAVRVVMSFETEEQARRNAETRAVLASGPAPGQGGDFADRFTVDSARAEGEVVVLDLDPVERAYVVSDLGTGPVLFATC